MKFFLTPSERVLCSAILRKHSITYASSTQFFPSDIRDKVYVLYAWVRQADELVDNPQTDPRVALAQFRSSFEKAWKTEHSDDVVTNAFIRLAKALKFEKSWCDAFLDSMESDLAECQAVSRQERDRYIYGSAEVIGLMMARVMDVPQSALADAQALGKWMQLVNFLRDFREDLIDRHRVYIPADVLKKLDLPVTALGEKQNQARLQAVLEQQIAEIEDVKGSFATGVRLLPARCRFAIVLSIELYQWAVDQISRDPLVVTHRQLKPSFFIVLQKVFVVFCRQLFADRFQKYRFGFGRGKNQLSKNLD